MSDGLTEKGEMEINREGNLASCQPGSLCQFVPTEEAQVSVEGQVTGELTDHTYAAAPRPLLHITHWISALSGVQFNRLINRFDCVHHT